MNGPPQAPNPGSPESPVPFDACASGEAGTGTGKSLPETPVPFDECARRLKALADPDRLRIVECLLHGARNVGEIAAAVEDELVNVSHHLGVLRNAGLVLSTRQGRYVVYALHPTVRGEAARARGFLDLGCCRLELWQPEGPPRDP